MEASTATQVAPTISDLPYEIFSRHIAAVIRDINDIKAFRLVCKAWKKEMLLTIRRIRSSESTDAIFVRNVMTLFRSVHAIGLKSPEGLKNIIATLSDESCQVNVLDLSKCALQEGDFINLARSLAVNTNLQSLDLSSTGLKLTKAQILVQHLPVNDYLNFLSFSGVSRTALAVLLPAITAKLRKVRNLYLNSCDFSGEIGGKALGEFISTNTSVFCLNVSTSKLDDAAVKHLQAPLAQNSTLTMLDLSWNSFGVPGTRALCQGMIQNKSIDSLLMRRSVALSTEAVEAVCQLLETSETLRKLETKIENTNDFLRYCQAIANSKCVRSVDFNHDIYLSKDRAVGLNLILQQTQTLETLHVHVTSDAFSRFAAAIGPNKTVTELRLTGMPLSSRDLEQLGAALLINTTIKRLHLSSYMVSYAIGIIPVFTALAAHPKIETLGLTHYCRLSDEEQAAFIDMLEKSKTLRSLVFHDTSSDPVPRISYWLIQGLKKSSSVAHADLSWVSTTQANYSELRAFAESWSGSIQLPQKRLVSA